MTSPQPVQPAFLGLFRFATAASGRRRIALCAAGIGALVLVLVNSFAAPANTTLVPETNIPLADVSGRIDHMAIDLGRKHLFIAELGHNSVDIIDLETNKILRQIDGLSEPQGLGYAAGSDIIIVASAGDGTVRLFSGEDFSPQATLELGEDADDVRVDRHTGNVLVGYGSGGLAIIDPAKQITLADIPLPAHPEGFEVSGARIYVNVPSSHQIAVVDLGSNQVVANRPVHLSGNFPMAMDAAGKSVATVFRDTSTLTLFDAETGKSLAEAGTCGDADDLFFDDKRGRLYVSCGEGAVDVFARDGTDLTHLDRIASAKGARTSLFVPDLDRLFVAQPAGSAAASIQVYRPN